MGLDDLSGLGLTSQETFAGTERFAPVRRLGAGGMGVVFEVFDRERDENVALKTLRHMSAQSLYYLKQEFRSLQGMHHPNLVRLLELIESEGHWFFTMELIRGGDFLFYVRGANKKLGVRALGKGRAEEIADTQVAAASTPNSAGSNSSSSQDSGRLSDAAISPLIARGSGIITLSDEGRLRSGLLGILDGLTALHDTGMIHRDIKPSNVMVTHRERVVLLDFGLTAALAKRKHLDGETQRMMGTPGYMSPEQYGSTDLSPASDLYSVGVTLYEALTGHLPHSGPIAEIMESCRTPPTRPSKLGREVAKDLDDLCMDLLQYEPSRRPSLAEVRARLGTPSQRHAVSSRLRAVTPRLEPKQDASFVGRAQELETLNELFDEMLSGHTVSVLVEGVSGIGKSALVRRFLRSAEDERASVVLMGRCYERESVPYKAFDSLVDDLRRYLKTLPTDSIKQLLPDHMDALVQLFPVLELRRYPPAPKEQSAANMRDLRSRAFAALKQLLRRLARHVDLIIFIDDLQWGDADSAALLRELLRPPDAPTLLFVATYRNEAADDPMIVSVAAEQRRLRLDPLPAQVSHALIDQMAREHQIDVERWLEQIVREGQGSPFFIGEIVRHLKAKPEADLDAGFVDGTLLRQVIHERVTNLPAEAASVMRAAAVIGRPVSRQLLCDVAALNKADARRSVELLVAANMLRVDRKDNVGVYHDQLREAVVAELSPRKVRDIYKRVRGAYEASGSDGQTADLLGLDYLAESDPERALVYAERAAGLAEAAFAFGRAARLYELAVGLASGDRRRELLSHYARALHIAGYGADAAKAYLELAQDAAPDEGVELTRLAADDLLHAGHIEEGLARLGEVARQLGVKVGRSKARTVLSIGINRARISMRGLGYTARTEEECAAPDLARIDSLFAAATSLGVVDHLNGTLMQTEHLLFALKVGEERRVWRAIAAEVAFLAVQGGRAAVRAEKLQQQVVEHADRLDDDYLRAAAHMGAAYLHLFRCEYPAAHKSFDATYKLLRSYPDAWWERNTSRYWDCLSLVTMGLFNRVGKLLPRLIHTAEEHNDRHMRSALRGHATVLFMLRDDRADEIDAELDAALDGWPEGREYVAHYTVMISRVAVRLYQGRAAEALDILANAKSLIKQLLVHRLPFIKSEVDKLTAVGAVALGNRKLAMRNIRALEKFGTPMASGYSALYRAPFLLSDGRADEARDLVESAIPYFDQCNAQHDAASARYRLGQLTEGETGDVLKAQARKWFKSQKVVNRARMIKYLSPGFSELDPPNLESE